MNAIIYTTNTGSTERYARLLAQETGLPAYSLAEAKKRVFAGAEVIYLGWIMAGSVKGYAMAAKRYRVRAICGVGMHKVFAAAVLAAMLLSLTACGKLPTPDKSELSPSTGAQVEPSNEVDAPASEGAPADADTSSNDEAWKTEFEKSLLENYGVTPDHYEDLGDGVYQVYVEIDGKVVPYVAVDSTTGDYHG